MTCPYCNRDFPLTWSRYAPSPFGRHTCPHCGKRSALKATLAYIAVLVIETVVVYGVALVIRAVAFPDRWRERPSLLWFLEVSALAFLVTFPIDRFYDARFRKLQRSRRDTHAH